MEIYCNAEFLNFDSFTRQFRFYDGKLYSYLLYKNIFKSRLPRLFCF